MDEFSDSLMYKKGPGSKNFTLGSIGTQEGRIIRFLYRGSWTLDFVSKDLD